jgi:hypothetical protein
MANRKQENIEASKKVQRYYRLASNQADTIEEMLIRQRMSFVQTSKERFVMTWRKRYVCSTSCVRIGSMNNMQHRHTHKFICNYCLTTTG